MDCHCIPHTQVPHNSRLFLDFLYDFPKVKDFYIYNPFQEESLSKAAQAVRLEGEVRGKVAAVLREQNQRLGASQNTLQNLARLESADCVAVVTGQQAGLFTGPVFSLYKGLTAIKLAQALSGRGVPAVPLFWMATEDHDFEEANHCFVQDRDGKPQRLLYASEDRVENAPVGSISFTEAIRSLIDELRTLLPDSEPAAELLRNISECYQPGRKFGEAFGGLIARVFAQFGIIIVDPSDARLHALSAPVFRRAIESAPELLSAVQQRNQQLIQSGYHVQVHVPDNFSFLFVYVDGQRRALRMRDGRFVTAPGDSYSPGELITHLERNPEMFSANALLRPIMQDALLPTVAYVGGPGEVAYFAQASVIYQHILGRMPVVFPRASFTILDSAADRLLHKYGLALPDIYAGQQQLRDKMALHFLPPDLTGSFQKATANLEADLQGLQAALAKLDPTLVDAAANSSRKMQYQLSTLEHKAAAAIQRRSEQIERDAVRLEESVYPNKTPQERLYSGVSFLARHGSRFLNELYEQISVHSSQHQVITL